MEQKQIQNISSDIKTIYEKALQVIDKRNFDYAIELLKIVVIKEPGFIAAREKLREIEKINTKSGFFKKTLSALKINKLVKSGQLALLRKKNKEAMMCAEEALAIDIKNLSALKLLSDAGDHLDAAFISIEAYELAYSFYPENAEVIKKLADLYRQNNMGKEELKLRHILSSMFPDNLEYKAEVRSAAAVATMEKNNWENSEGSFRDKLKDTKESIILEQKEKIIHKIEDIKDIVISLEEKLESNPDSVEVIKELAWVYYKGEDYNKAAELFKKLQEKYNIFDIAINKALEVSEITILQEEMKILKSKDETPDLNQKIKDLNSTILNLSEKYAAKRVKLYPNDLELHFDFAMANWKNNNIDSAIEHFQVSQGHPKWKIPSTISLGRCFYEKNRYDMAIDQFKKAIDLTGEQVNKFSLEAIYYLGLTFEKIKDCENAFECFKQIYSVNSTYRDVSEKVQKYYDNKNF